VFFLHSIAMEEYKRGRGERESEDPLHEQADVELGERRKRHRRFLLSRRGRIGEPTTRVEKASANAGRKKRDFSLKKRQNWRGGRWNECFRSFR